MDDKDMIAEYQKQQTCEGNTNQSWTIPEGPAVQGQKDRHVRTHNKHFESQTQNDKSYTHIQTNHERQAEPIPVSEIEKSYIEAHVHPDNWQEKDNDYTINAK